MPPLAPDDRGWAGRMRDARQEEQDVDAYFVADGEAFVPTEHSAGPWAPGSMSGRQVLGLAARGFEQVLPDATWLPARMTVDLIRMATLDPVTVHVDVRRAGRSALVVDLELVQGDRPVALARGLASNAALTPETHVWERGVDVPVLGEEQVPRHPDHLLAMVSTRLDETGEPAAEWTMGPGGWQTKPVGPGVCWMHEEFPLVAGEELTPYVRLGLAADVGSSVAHWGDAGLQFINADINLQVSRLPQGRMIGLEAIEHQHVGGVAIGTAVLRDHGGSFGTVHSTAVHNPMLAGVSFGG